MTDNQPKPRIVEISSDSAGQRIDNFLFKTLKGVPKTRIYKALRKGEVRVNGARKKAPYHLVLGDKVRIPPIRCAQSGGEIAVPPRFLEQVPVLFEDKHLLIVNKPAGVAVHGGTGLAFGVIEAFRALTAEQRFLELVHRLDRETSGCLMMAKSRTVLLHLQHQLGDDRSMEKYYIALVKGRWRAKNTVINHEIRKQPSKDGMSRMVVDRQGQKASSVVDTLQLFEDCTLVRIALKTGRMHQARVHCAHMGHPIAGDRLYGDDEFNITMRKRGLGRLFLHASELKLNHPVSGERLTIAASLPPQGEALIDSLSIRQ